MKPGDCIYVFATETFPLARADYSIETCPRRNELYVVCQDGSIKARWEPSRRIGWRLIEEDNMYFYECGHYPQSCVVSWHSALVLGPEFQTTQTHCQSH